MKRLLALAGAALLAALVLVQIGSGPSRDATSHSAARDARLVAAAHAAFIKDMSSHATAVNSAKWTSPGLKHAGAKTSNGSLGTLPTVNWSGYTDAAATSATTFSHVSGHWTIPSITCEPRPYQYSDAFLANWVGLDGVLDETVEQLGTGAQCYEGQTFYYVWYEMYPNATVQEGTLACINDNVDCPRPGDHISASVNVKPGAGGENNYTLSLTDYTTAGNNFTVTQQCLASTCQDSSAEWVIERPAVFIGADLPQILPLADFHHTGFTNGFVVANGRPSSILGFNGPVYDVTMADDTTSYYLDCIGQFGPGDTLLTTSPNQCPTVPPFHGNSFFATWDAGF
jgi:Peptidase A4 family